MADKEITERWTVPQASVWIRTCDLATVREMDPRTARSLVETALAFPGALTASGYLVAALRAGRVSTLGSLDLRLDGAAPGRILGDGRERTPREFWQSGGTLSDYGGSVVAAAPDDAGRWADLDVEANACIGHWQPPSAILADGARSLGQFAAQLRPEPIDRLRWLLTHPAVIVTGLYERAERPERMTLDRAALARAVIDCEADTVTDGRLSWSAVMVELACVEIAEPPPAIPKRQLSQTALCKADLLLTFPPDGKPTGTRREIANAVEKQTKRVYTESVFRVALGRKKP